MRIAIILDTLWRRRHPRGSPPPPDRRQGLLLTRVTSRPPRYCATRGDRTRSWACTATSTARTPAPPSAERIVEAEGAGSRCCMMPGRAPFVLRMQARFGRALEPFFGVPHLRAPEQEVGRLPDLQSGQSTERRRGPRHTENGARRGGELRISSSNSIPFAARRRADYVCFLGTAGSSPSPRRGLPPLVHGAAVTTCSSSRRGAAWPGARSA